ncbi:MAG TPA: 4-hydroxy-tetrahydrodipicolinate synthase [Gaiellaceae bacterium]|nr:4-hydroxy-tetrahydrodipicolinate synthase [Gaiellaceae bacterium]
MLGEVLTAAVTPFAADGSVNYEAFKRLCAHLVDTGSDGVVVAGTTGEGPTLTDGERIELFAAAVEAIGDRATVVAGTGTYSTAHSVHLTRDAHGVGVDAFLVVTPYYSKPPVRGIVAHFEAIAAVTDKPIVVYNIPQRVVLNLEPETLIELAEIPNVQYVKQATPDLEQAKRIVNESGLTLLAGNDDLLLSFLELGGKGGVFVFTHLVGQRVRELIDRFRAGDLEGARAIEAELEPVIKALAIDSNPIPVKAAMDILGHDIGIPRLPLAEATEEQKTQLRATLERVGVLAAAQA